VPDVILQMRNPEQDEFIILACDGIWDVQTRQECVEEVAKIFQGGESDVGLLCEEVCVDLGLRCLAVSLFSLIVSCVPL
jgi:serine/threonine protein phosphatase PrpC